VEVTGDDVCVTTPIVPALKNYYAQSFLQPTVVTTGKVLA
jgi:hypothetical protein